MVTFIVKTATETPVEGALIQILSNSGVLLHQLQTSNIGEAAVDLAQTTYIVLISWQGHAYSNITPFTKGQIVVDAPDKNFVFTVTTDMSMGNYCTVIVPASWRGTLRPYRASLQGSTVIFGDEVPPAVVNIETPCTNLIKDGVYSITSTDISDILNDVSWLVKVPRVSSIDLRDLVFPEVISWQLSEQTVSVSVGETAKVPLVIKYTGGLSLSVSGIPTWFSVKTLQPEVASVSIGEEDGELRLAITGLSAGDTTIIGYRSNPYRSTGSDVVSGSYGITVTA
jgi:hypothetical protein